MEIKSTILISIKRLRIFINLTLLYFVIYNTYFGWNFLPINDLERNFDLAFKVMLGFSIGWVLNILIEYIKFMINVQIHNLKHQTKQ